MNQNAYSRTALRVAMRRAAHQVLDRPRVFEDPYALRILPPEAAAQVGLDPEHEQRPFDRALRTFVAVRSRFAEDEFAEAVARGVRQYVALGAGLDTFAWRNPSRSRGARFRSGSSRHADVEARTDRERRFTRASRDDLCAGGFRARILTRLPGQRRVPPG